MDDMLNLFEDTEFKIEVDEFAVGTWVDLRYDRGDGETNGVHGLVVAHSVWNNQFRIDYAQVRHNEYCTKIAKLQAEGKDDEAERLGALMDVDPRQGANIEEYFEEPQLEIYTGYSPKSATKVWRSRIKPFSKVRMSPTKEIATKQQMQTWCDAYCWSWDEYDEYYGDWPEGVWRPVWNNADRTCQHPPAQIRRDHVGHTHCAGCNKELEHNHWTGPCRHEGCPTEDVWYCKDYGLWTDTPWVCANETGHEYCDGERPYWGGGDPQRERYMIRIMMKRGWEKP